MFSYTTWKPVVGYGGDYMVSDCGKVLSLKRAKPRRIRASSAPGGYLKVSLCEQGSERTHLVHRTVLEAHVGPCPKGMECGHLDGNPANNHVGNLKWVTKKENGEHRVRHGTAYRTQGTLHGMCKLTESDVHAIRLRLRAGETQYAIARDYGVQQPLISRVHTGKLWSHI